MKRSISIMLVVAGSSFAVADNYVDNDATVTQDCSKDGTATVAGNKNKITFTGACTKIGVMGNENTITIESAKEVVVAGNKNTVAVDASDKLSVPGNKNTVSWKKGLSGKQPKVSAPGTANKITQAK
jgi:hypothetical protein